jgi:hypothetical protein
MFKSRHIHYRKFHRPLPPLVFLAAIPLVLIVLELLARIFVGIAGKSAELAAYEGSPAIVTAYCLKFLGSSQQPYNGLSDRGELAAQRNPAVGYSLVGNQKSNFWRINEQGFRNDNPVPLTKPNNEIRIFLIGGSTAFGQWSPNNQATIASKLEARLNERVAQQKRSPQKYRPTILPVEALKREKAIALPLPLRDGRYRVINAAVPGYSSGNEFAQLFFQILPYSPDAVLVLDGYSDLILPSNKAQTDIPNVEGFLTNAPGHFGAHVAGELKHLATDSFLVKATQYWLLRPQPSVSQLTLVATNETGSLEKHLAADSTELQRRVARYRDRQKQMVNLMTGAKIPLIVAVQPEVTGRSTSKLSPREKTVLNDLGTAYKERIQSGYAELARVNQQIKEAYPKNAIALNFYKLDGDFPKGAFYDAIHLTEEGNAVLAEQFYRAVTGLAKLQVAPPKPPKL